MTATSAPGPFAPLERLVEDGAREQVAHLEAHQGLAARAVDFDTSTSRQ